MSEKLINVVLTGGTGTLGSQIIYELLKLKNIKTIFLPARQKNGKSALARINTILESDAAPEFISKNVSETVKKIHVLDMDTFFNPRIDNFKSSRYNTYGIYYSLCYPFSYLRDTIFS